MALNSSGVLRGRPKVLAIDDTPANLVVLASALSNEFSFQLASSGTQGLALAAANLPDLVLLDIMMPEMDGYETCRRFKSHPLLAEIPIVFVTALTDLGSELKGLELGAVDYFYKPIAIEIARQRIRNHLERKQANAYERFYGKMLELLVSGTPLSTVLEAIAQGIGKIHPDLTCCISLLDSPSLLPGPTDADISPKTRQVPDDWPMILRSSTGSVLGEFSVSFLDGRVPTSSDRNWIEQSAHLASIAIERSQASEKLRESEAHFRLLSEDVSDVVWRTDRHLRVTYISPADERLRGYAPERVIGSDFLEMFSSEDVEAIREAIVAIAPCLTEEVSERAITFEARHICRDARLLWGEVQLKPMRDAMGWICGYHGITRDTTARKKLEDQVRQLAFYDPLTKLPNRRLFNDRLSQSMSGSHRNDTHCALMMMDLDNFKPLNDLHGHMMGDLLLVEVARRLQQCVREVDTVARFGGDEFVVLLCDLSLDRDEARGQARLVAEKIRLELSRPYALKMVDATSDEPGACVDHCCSVSIGMFVYMGKSVARDDALKYADDAMYQAKAAGRNAIRMYSN